MKGITSSLLRFFDKEEYAVSFLDGEMRFGLLNHYKSIKGERRDEKEGQVSFDWDTRAPQFVIDKESKRAVLQTESDRRIHYSGTSLNPCYILCTSHPQASISDLAEKFGNFVVLISDPLALLVRIRSVWQSNPLALPGGVSLTPVTYNRDGLLEPNRFLVAPFEYSYSQKPSSYKEEREFRYVLKCAVDAERKWEDFITLHLGNCRDVCSLMDERSIL